MIFITYPAFCILGVICIGLQYCAIKSRKDPSIGNNPMFKNFQWGYFAAYFPALLGDWLQGPYLYKLYSYYGFQEDQIAVLYVVGFASTVLLGTWAPVAADRYGRKKLCVVFTVVYSLACFFKLSRNYAVLLMGRILGGVATSLLFSAFEAWYVHEHVDTHDFPKEWIAVTFNRASVWNGILAIVAGVLANTLAEWANLGPVAPFILAIPFLIMSGLVVITRWEENYSKQKVKLRHACMAGLKNIFSDPKIFLIGIIISLFESSMYIFVFLWTPILNPANPSLGIVFSSFMVCTMIGSAIFQLLQSQRVPVIYLLSVAIIFALLANIVCVIATEPDDMNRNLAFVAFLVIETSVGMYCPAMAVVQSRIIPEVNRVSIINWFRVPLNLIACAVLMMLHNDSFRHGNVLIFVTCTGLLAAASMSVIKLISLSRDDDELRLSEEEYLTEHNEL